MHTVDTIMSEMMKLRVHIAPVGFEIDRVVIPAIKMKADKVYLLRHNDYSEDKSGPYLDKIVKKLVSTIQDYVLQDKILSNAVFRLLFLQIQIYPISECDFRNYV